ncbi:hypothetical protein AAFF_G00409520, partial [Aldrovandia affinis]
MEEKLITAICGTPILYNVSLQEYRDKNKINDAWTAVAAVVCFPVDVCRKKWKSLRTTYRREMNKEKTKKRSGAGAVVQRPWRYTEVMSFLHPFIQERETSGNMEDDEGEEENRQESPEAVLEREGESQTPG